MPGVSGAGYTQKLPLRGGGWSFGFELEGSPDSRGTTSFVRFGSPGYLEVLGVKLTEGRLFTDADLLNVSPNADGVVVVNEALVKKYFGGANPIGKRIATGTGGWSRVIGVACLLLCLPFGPAMSVRLFVGVALGFAWITAYGVSLLRGRE